MFEFYQYPTGKPVAINPKYIVAVEPDGDSFTHIAVVDGRSYVVREKYDVVKQHIANYLPPL